MKDDLIGRRLSHYRITGVVAAGGMGVVYRAEDENLRREIAIKVLSPESLASEESRTRFRREAQILSRMSHPAVATVFDFDTDDGLDFLVMELVPGVTLESKLATGALPLDAVTNLGAQLAAALHAAHHLGIVHRDFKPSNVMLQPDGSPKVLDFGLARWTEARGGQRTTALTQAGALMGTLRYMAPEQVLGQEADARSDIHALGAVLYEMSTGRPPFRDAVTTALIYAIVNTAPEPPRILGVELPEALEAVILRCLEKEPTRRFDSAGEVAELLRESGKAGLGVRATGLDRGIRALAVLPLENLSRDPAQEYFADGMTEALISDLSQIEALRVISRTSAMRYKGVDKSLPDIARELGVDAVIEGSALLVGKRVRITAQLIDARQDRSLWSRRYERELEDVLALQSEVARAVAEEIRVQLTPREQRRLGERPTVHPEAHVAYLKGRHQWNKRSPEGVESSIRFYEEALDLDPGYAAAWAGLADSHMTRAYRGMAPPQEAAESSRKAALRALEIDPLLGEAHAALGEIQFRADWDWSGALKSLRRAIELSPGIGIYHVWYAMVLSSLGRHEEALSAGRRALAIDPLAMIIHTAFGDVLYFARDYEQSIVYYRKAIELDPHFDGGHTDLARSYEEVGRYEEALAEYREGARLTQQIALPSLGIAHLYARSGEEARARKMRDDLVREREHRVVPAWGLATLCAVLGDADEAFRWLDTAIEDHEGGLVFLRTHPRLDSIRSDPRYQRLLVKLGFEDGESDGA